MLLEPFRSVLEADASGEADGIPPLRGSAEAYLIRSDHPRTLRCEGNSRSDPFETTNGAQATVVRGAGGVAGDRRRERGVGSQT